MQSDVEFYAIFQQYVRKILTDATPESNNLRDFLLADGDPTIARHRWASTAGFISTMMTIDSGFCQTMMMQVASGQQRLAAHLQAQAQGEPDPLLNAFLKLPTSGQKH